MGGFFFLYICLMASVNLVYKTLKDMVNKDQQGFITPDTFNNFASIAQLKIYNRLFDNLKNAQRNIKAGFDRGRDKGLTKRIQEDLSVFSKTSSTITRASDGTFAKPSDLSRIISIYSSGDIIMSSSSRKPMEVCYDEEKIERILISNISAPTGQFPVALVSNVIEVFPESIMNIKMRYYKTPSVPEFAYTVVGGSEVYNANNSNEFDLPDHYEDQLVIEIAELIGVSLREQYLNQTASGEQAQKQREESF